MFRVEDLSSFGKKIHQVAGDAVKMLKNCFKRSDNDEAIMKNK